MGVFDFVKNVGKKLGFGDDEEAPKAEAVKKELDSHDLGTDQVQVVVEDDRCVLKGLVADQATYDRPHAYPTGIRWVLVNGQVILRDGERLPVLPGRVLLRAGDSPGRHGLSGTEA